MSFILDALKKSEKQKQKKNGQVVRTVYEAAPEKKSSPRYWGIVFLILLLVNAALLLWFFSPWQSTSSSQPQSETTAVVEGLAPSVVTPKIFPTPSVPVEQKTSSAEKKQTRIVAQLPAKTLPAPRNEKKVYRFSQLPISIQNRIPPLKMSLHAFNREQASASLVQLNDRILREGDNVTERLRLEKITAEGVILFYDGYHFILSRRGN